MRRTLSILMLALLSSPLIMNSQILPSIGVQVPADLSDVAGPDVSRFPFGYPAQPAFGIPERPVRYQQVYDASAFTDVPPGGAFVTRMFIRSDCGVSWGPRVTNVTVRLSTAARRPDELSANFTENIGPDETTVARLTNFAPPGYPDPSCPTPRPPREVPLELPFWYDPARGNLLLDMRVSGVTPYPDDELPPTWWRFAGEEEYWPHNKLDAVSVIGDAFSRAAAFSLETDIAEVLDTMGLWTMFQFSPLPSLAVGNETNAVVLSWPVWPQAFRLQWADRLEASASWQYEFAEPTRIGNLFHLAIPRQSLGSGRFYRLTLDTPQPLDWPITSGPVFLEPNKIP